MLPDHALPDQLVEAYFTRINPWCTIVDEDTFMGQYRRRDPADPLLSYSFKLCFLSAPIFHKIDPIETR
jgi:hypothetical protein